MLARLVLYLLLAADGRGIAVVSTGTPDDGCPSARQVTDALGVKLPGVAAPPGSPLGPSQVRLAVAADSNGIRIDITDPAGAPLLRRVLPPAPRARTSDCVVLAETVALIVERYWREVGYDVPASPPPSPAPVTPPPAPRPPPPKTVAATPKAEPSVARTVTGEAPARERPPLPLAAWSLGAALAGRTNVEGDLDPTLQLAAAGERKVHGLDLGLRLSGGVGTGATGMTPTGTADVRHFPLRVGLYIPINTALGRIEPGLGAGVDLIAIDVASEPGNPPPPPLRASSLCSASLCASPGADLALGWSMLWEQHVYLRLMARGGVAVPFRLLTDDRMGIARTPRSFLELALESGVWFP